MLRSLLIVVVCTLNSCRSPESRFASMEEMYRDDMVAWYPPGSDWCGPRDKWFGEFTCWQLDDPAPDLFAKLSLAHARARSSDLRSCWWGRVPRITLGSSFGAMGLYVDYVFLDSADRVVVAYRRFLD
jgi:hypothetical protein